MSGQTWILAAMVVAGALPWACAADDSPLVLAGPAFGTTYRVVMAAEVRGFSRGEVHREIEAVLARIDAALSTWRDDSDVSRFNRAPAGEWVEVGEDLAGIVAIARHVHAETDGVFDITVGPLVHLWRDGRRPTPAELIAVRSRVGMDLVESLPAAPGHPAALCKKKDGLMLDLAGIGPGYGVDAVGEHLASLGSRSHLVELGGEARAWGTRPDGGRWRVAVSTDPAAGCDLPPGRAIACSTIRANRPVIDPRTGRPIAAGSGTFRAEADSCAVADALAVARAIVAATSRDPLETGDVPD